MSGRGTTHLQTDTDEHAKLRVELKAMIKEAIESHVRCWRGACGRMQLPYISRAAAPRAVGDGRSDLLRQRAAF